MKPLRPSSTWTLVWGCLLVGTLSGPADQVQLQNGDRYNGKVLSLDDKSLTLQNDVLGKVTLPRAKIAVVLLGPQAAWPVTNPAASTAGVKQTNSLAADLASHSNLIQQVQRQFLSGADPQAQQKFNSLVSGLLDGSITVEDVQREARTAADQVRALKKELGPDASFALDGYLAILDQFLKEAPAEPAPTNSPVPRVSPRTD
jgi:hypothetical protein